MFNNEKGFSFAELMVAVGLAGVVMLFSVKFFNIVKSDNKRTQNELLSTLSEIQFEQIVRRDLQGSKSSYSILELEDENGDNFFDYFFDSPCREKCQREIELVTPDVENEYSKSFAFIVEDKNFSRELLYEPKLAFDDYGLDFVSLNQHNTLSGTNPHPWKAGKLIMVYSRYPIRKDASNFDNEAPKLLAYLGWVSKDNATTLTAEKVEIDGVELFRDTDPRDDSVIDSEEEFLRKVPTYFGLPVGVYLSSVRVVRYRIKAFKEKGKIIGRLVRGVKIVGGDYRESVIADDVKSLKFKRLDISTPEIVLEMN